jgi:hypothetical protein
MQKDVELLKDKVRANGVSEWKLLLL